MPAGKPFTPSQARDIERVLDTARHETGLRFSVYVGEAQGDARDHARRRHAMLQEPSRAVLVFVEPAARRLEIVTGSEARRRVDDGVCALAAMSMTTAFSVGDLTGGIVAGVSTLADHARQAPIAHETPPG